MKWILVTGGSKGLGEAICRKLAHDGHSIVIHYCKAREKAMMLAQDLRNESVNVEIMEGDFSSSEGQQDFIRRYIASFKETKAIIHNVGSYLAKPLIETAIEEIHSLFMANFFAPFAITKALIPSIIHSKGSIIHIGESGTAKGGPKKHAPAYFMSKEALWQQTLSLAHELAKYEVRVNMVSPGILENAVDLERFRHSLPMQRPGKLEEVSEIVAHLLSSKSSYITGQNIEVSGGFGL